MMDGDCGMTPWLVDLCPGEGGKGEEKGEEEREMGEGAEWGEERGEGRGQRDGDGERETITPRKRTGARCWEPRTA